MNFVPVTFPTLLAVCFAVSNAVAADPLPKTVRFNRDIRPLLSDRCYKCHGPDSTQRKADLRLDTKAGLFAKRGDVTPVVPLKTAASELLRRITSPDPDVKMPPPTSGRKLSKAEIALIRKWVAQGANWEPHWAFIPPKKPRVPDVRNRERVVNPIDAFVLAKLERNGLSLSPEAKKTTLLRRVTLDLTGLPPTLKEIDHFLADKSPNAYEKVVDRLLKSRRYGEKMAVHWLDAARFADTSGYQNDGPRSMYRWRDWVIYSFVFNKPYNEFVLEQLAGDMLPKATLDQKIATAFNRNHRGNAEGGIIPEEYQVEYVVDRVESTFTVFQGLTMGCARCHDHKFDPISQKDFYRSFAFFNNIPENGRAIKEGNSPPYIKAPTRTQQKILAGLDRQVAAAEKRFRDLQPEFEHAQREWVKSFTGKGIDWTVDEGLIAHFPFEGSLVNRAKPASDGRKPSEASYTSGRFGRAVALDGSRFVDAGNVGHFGYFDKFSLGAWIHPADKRGGTIVSRMTDVEHGDGYALVLKHGKLHVNLVKRWLDDSIRVETKRAIPLKEWTHVFATYDGSRLAKGLRIYVNGRPQELTVHLDGINQSFDTKEPLRIGAGGGPASRFRGLIDDVRVYNRDHSDVEAAIVAEPETISQIVGIPAAKRTPAQRQKLRAFFLAKHAPVEIRAAYQRLVTTRKTRDEFFASIPTVMVMQEMPTPRETFVLKRGEYDKPGERVFPGIPESLAGGLKHRPKNRLEFARWIASRDNPLTARVAVNRFWQMLFGVGLVKTTEDFGSQGEQPSHPQLLDWLAVEFMDSGWNVKRLLKTIVMSGAYRQSSVRSAKFISHELPAVRNEFRTTASDPENRLLSRAPRFRMPAEMIRDQALFISGLLTERTGGPSVLPYQPAGLWKEIATDTKYDQSHGADLYRRSMYIYWKRTVSPPVMAAFDAPTREFCTVRRPRTNTPLQALALLNEVSFVEAARVFAQRMMVEGGKTPAERIAFGFRLATSRNPSAAELQILTAGFQVHLAKYRKDHNGAVELISTGEAPRNKKLDPTEHAAYTAIGSVILNLDEVVTKE